MSVTWLQFIELPSNELTEMLALQPKNIEEIRSNQEAIAERIEDQREDIDQGNNQVEVAEPTEEKELDQEEDFVDLLAKASYILDQDDDPEEVEGSQEEEILVAPPLKILWLHYQGGRRPLPGTPCLYSEKL